LVVLSQSIMSGNTELELESFRGFASFVRLLRRTVAAPDDINALPFGQCS
jgi:hypothetical protein